MEAESDKKWHGGQGPSRGCHLTRPQLAGHCKGRLGQETTEGPAPEGRGSWTRRGRGSCGRGEARPRQDASWGSNSRKKTPLGIPDHNPLAVALGRTRTAPRADRHRGRCVLKCTQGEAALDCAHQLLADTHLPPPAPDGHTINPKRMSVKHYKA